MSNLKFKRYKVSFANSEEIIYSNNTTISAARRADNILTALNSNGRAVEVNLNLVAILEYCNPDKNYVLDTKWMSMEEDNPNL
jgi:hypothetical protein